MTIEPVFYIKSTIIFNSFPLVEGLYETGKRVAQSFYIDPYINRENVLSRKIDAFDIVDYAVEYDDRCHCKNCIDNFIQLSKTEP